MSRANCDYCHISAARCFKSFYFPHVGCIVLVRFSIIIFSTLLRFCMCITFICFHMYLQCNVRSTHMILFQIMPLFASPELLFIMMLNSCSVMQTSTGLQKIEPFLGLHRFYTESAQLTVIQLMIFWLHDGVRALCIQQRPYFEFWPFPGLGYAVATLSWCWAVAVSTVPTQLCNHEGRQRYPAGTHCVRWFCPAAHYCKCSVHA